MIISVSEARELLNLGEDLTDAYLERKLNAIEQAIRSYTNNNFQDRDIRRKADIVGGTLYCEAICPFEEDDTVQITQSKLNKGLYTVYTVGDADFMLNEDVKDEENVLITKVYYPADVVDCALNLLSWDIKSRDKVGIQSETLSRHSVSYFNMDGDNSLMGYPKSLLGTLRAYRKARF